MAYLTARSVELLRTAALHKQSGGEVAFRSELTRRFIDRFRCFSVDVCGSPSSKNRVAVKKAVLFKARYGSLEDYELSWNASKGSFLALKRLSSMECPTSGNSENRVGRTSPSKIIASCKRLRIHYGVSELQTCRQCSKRGRCKQFKKVPESKEASMSDLARVLVGLCEGCITDSSLPLSESIIDDACLVTDQFSDYLDSLESPAMLETLQEAEANVTKEIVRRKLKMKLKRIRNVNVEEGVSLISNEMDIDGSAENEGWIEESLSNSTRIDLGLQYETSESVVIGTVLTVSGEQFDVTSLDDIPVVARSKLMSSYTANPREMRRLQRFSRHCAAVRKFQVSCVNRVNLDKLSSVPDHVDGEASNVSRMIAELSTVTDECEAERICREVSKVVSVNPDMLRGVRYQSSDTMIGLKVHTALDSYETACNAVELLSKEPPGPLGFICPVDSDAAGENSGGRVRVPTTFPNASSFADRDSDVLVAMEGRKVGRGGSTFPWRHCEPKT